jgi:hypothetical protein
MRRILPNGAVMEIVPPTPEQRRREEDNKKRQREEAERRKRQMLKDYALLEAYKSVEEIEAARNRDLAALLARIEAAKKLLEGIERERKKLAEEEKFYEKRGPPPALKDQIASNEARRVRQKKIIAESEEAMARVNEEYDAKVKRYVELTRPPGKGNTGDDEKARRLPEPIKPIDKK